MQKEAMNLKKIKEFCEGLEEEKGRRKWYNYIIN